MQCLLQRRYKALTPVGLISRHIIPCCAFLLLTGSLAMSQTPTTPNLTNPTTADDFAAVKALLAAQADAADAQARLIASQKALKQAQAGTDPAAAQLASATQAAGVAAQQKALSDSQAAILKNNFTVPDSGFTGDIKPGDKAGTVESSLLAAKALNDVAQKIKTRIGTKGGASIVLYGGSDLPDFQALISYQAQYQIVSSTLDQSLEKINKSQEKCNSLLPPRTESPALIGAAFDAANKLLGFFRTDYAIQGVGVTPDDLLLISALSGVLNDKTVNVPALYNPAALAGYSQIISNLNLLTSKRVALQASADLGISSSADLITAAGSQPDATKKKAQQDAAADLKTSADQAKAAIALYDGLITKLTTPDDKAKVPLAAIIQQDVVHTLLSTGSSLLTAKISSAGGTYYTRKNLWSFFGGMPFFSMGGVVVSYALFDGKSGAVLSAGALPVAGGFVKVGKLAKFLEEPAK